MLSNKNSWTFTLATATSAVGSAAGGLALVTLAPGAAPMVATGLLATSLASTAGCFWSLAMRVRRLEMENMGLVEEISQEFDRVKDKLDIFADALAEPHTIPVEEDVNTPMRRVTIK